VLIHLKVWRFAPRAGRDRLLARTASRRKDRVARKTRSAPAWMWRIARYFCNDHKTLEEYFL